MTASRGYSRLENRLPLFRALPQFKAAYDLQRLAHTKPNLLQHFEAVHEIFQSKIHMSHDSLNFTIYDIAASRNLDLEDCQAGHVS